MTTLSLKPKRMTSSEALAQFHQAEANYIEAKKRIKAEYFAAIEPWMAHKRRAKEKAPGTKHDGE
jgi:hypothetical protein